MGLVRLLVFALLLVPQLAAARVYMCVDAATGNVSFTDKACEPAADREEILVQPTNVDSGRSTAQPTGRKVWTSDIDTRKTGRHYGAQWRQVGAEEAAVSVAAAGEVEGR